MVHKTSTFSPRSSGHALGMCSVHVFALSKNLFGIDEFREERENKEKERRAGDTQHFFSQRTRQRRLITHLATNRETTTMTTMTTITTSTRAYTCVYNGIYACICARSSRDDGRLRQARIIPFVRSISFSRTYTFFFALPRKSSSFPYVSWSAMNRAIYSSFSFSSILALHT